MDIFGIYTYSVSISKVFFCLGKLLFSDFLQFKGIPLEFKMTHNTKTEHL